MAAWNCSGEVVSSVTAAVTRSRETTEEVGIVDETVIAPDAERRRPLPPQEPRLVQRLPIATPRAPHVVTDEKPVRSSEHIELKELYAAGMFDADAAHVLSAAAGMLWY